MEIFTEAYDKSIAVLKVWRASGKLPVELADIAFLLRQDGPDPAYITALERLHTTLHKGASGEQAKEKILEICLSGDFGFQDRAALIKLMSHFHFVTRRGGQVVWVMDSPKDFENWVYDQFNGKNAISLVQEFRKTDEVFGRANRKMMADALMFAKKWSTDIEVKLARKDGKILDSVRRWFHSDADEVGAVQKTAGRLLIGFKKISNACNSSRIIFSDLPQLRSEFNEGGTIGAVAEQERLQTIYLFEAFLQMGKRDKFGNIHKMWLCALTIVHELSHMHCKAVDIFYDYQGLKIRSGFGTEDALNNAESWAYFAADAVEVLPEANRRKALGK